MDDLDQWPKKNGQFLTGAIEWLRYKLMYLAGSAPSRAEPAAYHVTLAPRRRWIFRLLFPPPTHPAELAPPKVIRSKPITAADVEAKEKLMNSAAAIDPPPALMILQLRFGLCDFERFVVLLCAAMELDTRIA